MAEFKCYVCNGPIKTGEKFTFTDSGAIHFDCFIHARRSQISPDKEESFRTLELLLDYQLDYLIRLLHLKRDGKMPEVEESYREIEKSATRTTKAILDL